uniref:Ovule protein n=1 Tax=Steinernema glaseri TaxID=37863 RepID=A0A1I7ZF96_9BILA
MTCSARQMSFSMCKLFHSRKLDIVEVVSEEVIQQEVQGDPYTQLRKYKFPHTSSPSEQNLEQAEVSRRRHVEIVTNSHDPRTKI